MTGSPDPGLLISRVAVDCYRGLVCAGGLNRAGLLYLRDQLDPELTSGRAWTPFPGLDLLRLEVNDALAAEFGVRPEDIPGAEQIPGSPAEIPPAPEVPPEQRPW